MTITYQYHDALYVNLTNRCPNACDFCLRTHGDKVGDSGSLWLEREPSKEEIWEDIEKRDLSKYRELVFCGYGEPACRLNDMLWICRQVRAVSGIKIRVNTNGLSDLINGRDTAPEYKGLFDTVSISLNASTPEKYDEICHSEYGLQALPAIVKFAEEVGHYVPDVCMTIVDTGLPEQEIADCRALCEKAGAHLRVRAYSESWQG